MKMFITMRGLSNILLKRTIYNRFRCHFKWKSSFNNEVHASLSKGTFKFSLKTMAELADGCCIAKLGATEVMATAVSSKKKTSTSFVPLQVDFRHKAAAAGRIPMNHKRRELGQSEKEILTCRIIDRSLRPLFPKGFSSEIQVSCNPVSIDHIIDPDVVSINAASAALAISNIPWNGPIAAVRIGLIDGITVINPARNELSKSVLNLVVAVTEHKHIVMMEGSANHVHEEQFMEAVEAGVNEAQIIIKAIKELQERFGKCKSDFDGPTLLSSDVLESATLLCEAKVTEIFRDYSLDKISRGIAVDAVIQNALEKLKENYSDLDQSIIYEAINSVVKNTFRNLVLETEIRCDGRSLKDLRPISCEINPFTSPHGCALFSRGQTRVYCAVTIDSIEAAPLNDISYEIHGEDDKNFMLHYEFPPYATNEIGRVGVFGRREIGHGALAEKSLRPVIPSEYPFAIRLTSEVLSSNGSSSMASVCGGSLALMDAGVPIALPVAGIAMGLIAVPDTQESFKIADYKILSDILGLEDYMGDMDFKIAGSKDGITAVQLDVKIQGLPLNIIKESLIQAAEGKNKILNIMNNTISKPREEKKNNFPVLENLEVPVHKISQLIGFGGMNLKKIRTKTGVQITNVENGIFSIFAPNTVAMSEAKEILDKILLAEKEPNILFGEICTAKIVEIREAGIMVILYPTMRPTLIKNFLLDNRKVKHASALGLEVDQEIQVKYLGRDPDNGQMRLSRISLKPPLSLNTRDHFKEKS